MSAKAEVIGNSLASVGSNCGPTILMAGHIDEIGVIVTCVDENGYLLRPNRRLESAGTRRAAHAFHQTQR
ncbi:hypothetical protein [Gemmatimonas sp.]|uniref:hypothetical protein n=1 Tax=Gemmatimonas sp. TaxID=1962908 RepID=UPI00286DA30E|nr:hypothetical protein [Gemmatimonas sp.]